MVLLWVVSVQVAKLSVAGLTVAILVLLEAIEKVKGAPGKVQGAPPTGLTL
jgi:hypothetical protein